MRKQPVELRLPVVGQVLTIRGKKWIEIGTRRLK